MVNLNRTGSDGDSGDQSGSSWADEPASMDVLRVFVGDGDDHSLSQQIHHAVRAASVTSDGASVNTDAVCCRGRG